MLVAAGLKTGKIYAFGKYRADVMRMLDKEYPYRILDKHKYIGKVYPEPLQLRRVRDDEMSILQPQTERHSRVSRTLETV